MYSLKIKKNLDEKLKKLYKKDRKKYEILLKKAEEVIKNPNHYKNLKSPLHFLRRVHIDKHFVLTFSIDEKTKTVTLEDFDHHDKIYLR